METRREKERKQRERAEMVAMIHPAALGKRKTAFLLLFLGNDVFRSSNPDKCQAGVFLLLIAVLLF